MCAVKLVGRKRDTADDAEPTQTLLVRTGRGVTAEDARRDALAQLTLVYGSPVEPPPAAVITHKTSDAPAPLGTPADCPLGPPSSSTRDPGLGPLSSSVRDPGSPSGRGLRGWLSRWMGRLRGG
jgi:hypothetical protein